MFRARAESDSTILAGLRLSPGGYGLATIHRQENADDPARLRSLFESFSRLAEKDRPIVVPLHPRTRNALRAMPVRLDLGPSVLLIPPVTYLDMIALETSAAVILTDSGGVQKEAAFAGVPCLTLRDETEWPETVEAGFNRVVGTDPERIARGFHAALKSSRSKPTVGSIYGNGSAARRIVGAIVNHLGRGGPGRS
jgi:UDP-N-acetylglucosamine 2-epimerase